MTSWNQWNELVSAENRYNSPNKNNRPSTVTKPTHIIIHITGTDDFQVVHDRFSNSSGGASAHYLIKKDGTIIQYAKDKYRAWHAGIQSYIKNLYDYNDGRWKKYLRYFSWYSGYGTDIKYLKADLSIATNTSERKLVSKNDESNWGYYSYWDERYNSLQSPVNYEINNDPNSYSIGIELLTVGGNSSEKYEDGLYTGLYILLDDLCDKYDIPFDKEHIIGHEDVNPVERWGWDPNSGFDWERVLSSKLVFLPMDLGSGLELTLENINNYYNHNEKDFPGGYFPIGLNMTWHGGIHLRPKQDSMVYNTIDGTIIAARLGENKNYGMGVYGSRNFILTAHPFHEHTLYQLYMHLCPMSRYDKKLAPCSWIPKKDLNQGGSIVKLNIPIQKGDPLWLSGEAGSGEYRTKLLHWEVFSDALIIAKPDCTNPSSNIVLDGNSGWSDDKTLRVQAMANAPANVMIDTTVEFFVSKVSYKDAPKAVLQNINWSVKTLSNSWSQIFAQQGPSLSLTIPAHLAGQTIKVQPYINSPAESISCQCLVHNEYPWHLLQDEDEDFNLDCAAIFKNLSIEQPEKATPQAIIEHYKEQSTAVLEYRNTFARFVSEWGIPDINKAVQTLRDNHWYTIGLSDRLKKYQIWEGLQAAGVSIPESSRLWHYHPVTILKLLSGLQSEDT
jgi:N-acetyl-anhydromuramyl-L-alanine amidase AmpD